MKKITIAVLIFSMVLVMCPVVGAATVSTDEALNALETLGLFKGTDSGPELDRQPTRSEALVILLRLMGLEADAESCSLQSTFTDVSGKWYEPYVAYAQSRDLVKGISSSFFGGDEDASVRDFLTFVLRALGYSEGSDFSWEKSISFSDSIGLTHGEYSVSSCFTREDAVLISYTALTLNICGSDMALIEKLYETGAVSYSDIVSTRLAGHVNYGRDVLTPSEIYEKCSSSVFTLILYENEDDMNAGIISSTASGFFVTSDGTAVMSYHALDGNKYAFAETTDGHRYELESVLYYDAFWDIAVVRISRTDTSGVTVTRFPYIDIGDSDAVSIGDAVYTVSSPYGLSDTMSEGIISSKNRIIDDPAYPCIQITAPISSGSSGGPLLNSRGEAIGVIYAMYAYGNSLYLCVPINSISGVNLNGEGESLEDVCEHMNELKKASTITSSMYDVALSVDESAELIISADCPVSFSAVYAVSQSGVVSCSWGDFIDKTTVPLTVTGISPGECSISISFYNGCGSEDYHITISVTVTE